MHNVSKVTATLVKYDQSDKLLSILSSCNNKTELKNKFKSILHVYVTEE